MKSLPKLFLHFLVVCFLIKQSNEARVEPLLHKDSATAGTTQNPTTETTQNPTTETTQNPTTETTQNPTTETTQNSTTTEPTDYSHNGYELVTRNTNELGSATLHGKTMVSLGGRTIESYQGLPYTDGAPTRFQRAELAQPFKDGTNYDATYIRDKCLQRANIHGGDIAAAGSEDCLYLNVYVPQIEDAENLPVMIFFHGGAFVWGDASLYLPTKLLDEDVILVTVHYRLGALSFFTTGTHVAVGNLALYDQNLSMQWVQAYISDFGGDPDMVTIFGQSAGSASVNYHLVSSLSAGLMKGVIAHSGSAIDVWALDAEPVESSFALAEYISNCDSLEVGDSLYPTDEELENLYDCMVHGDPEELAVAADLLSRADRKMGGMGFRAASPSIQGSLVPEPFVSEDPLLTLKNGRFNTDVTLMNGACAQEGSFVFGVMYSAFLYPNRTDDPYYFQNEMIGDLLTAVGISDKTGALQSSLKDTYFANSDMTTLESVTPGMIDLTGALFLKSGAKQTADYHSQYASGSTYLYAFEYEGSSSMFNTLFWGSGDARPPFDHGVTHTDDLLYIFSLPSAHTESDRQTIERMVQLWANFAKYQNPTPDGAIDDMSIPEWKSYDIEKMKYMLIRESFEVEADYENRYTVTGDSVVPSTTASSTVSPPVTGGCITYDPTYSELEDERDAYMISMIVFVIAFVVTLGGVIYLVIKNK